MFLEVCNLPQSEGNCEGRNLRWYYDPAREQCSQFYYGGCGGNDNNFDSQALCQQHCAPEKYEGALSFLRDHFSYCLIRPAC